MTAVTEHPAFSDEARAELVLTERLLPGCAVLFVRGAIDIATVDDLERAGTRLLESADGRLVLDLSETTFMDLSGVRTAERLSRLASDTGGSFVVIAVTPGVRRILALASHLWLAVTGDLDTALEAVSNRAGTSSSATTMTYRDARSPHANRVDELRRRATDGRVTVLYAARDREHDNAVVLTELLREGEAADAGP